MPKHILFAIPHDDGDDGIGDMIAEYDGSSYVMHAMRGGGDGDPETNFNRYNAGDGAGRGDFNYSRR